MTTMKDTGINLFESHQTVGKNMKVKKSKHKQSFDDRETWALNDTIANFIIPRLERYEEIANQVLIRDDKLKKDIQSFLTAMKLLARDDGIHIFTKKEEKQVEDGLNAFPKIFWTLWW